MDKQAVFNTIEQHYRTNYAKLHKSYNEDVIQEAYTRACQYWDSLQANGNFSHWFNAILRNCMKDYLRDERLQGMVNVEAVSEDIAPGSLDDYISATEIVDRIDQKEGDYKTVLRLAFIHQYRPREISKVVPLSRRAIASIINRFKEEVRNENQMVLHS